MRMVEVAWKEFPEINRKIAFTYNYTPGSIFLGCHCGSISGVQAYYGTTYYAALSGKNIEVLDKDKEKAIKYTMDSYTGLYKPPAKELELIDEHFKKINFKFSDISKEAYKVIASKCSSIPLWVMSDVINYEAPARAAPTGNVGTAYEIFGNTVGFAKWLIDNKIGYVMASPIIQNPSHRNQKNYSLNRGWFWIPPNHLERAINCAETHGDEKFPSKEDWIRRVGFDLNLSGPDVLKSVLNDGVFPEERRFKRYNEVVKAA